MHLQVVGDNLELAQHLVDSVAVYGCPVAVLKQVGVLVFVVEQRQQQQEQQLLLDSVAGNLLSSILPIQQVL